MPGLRPVSTPIARAGITAVPSWPRRAFDYDPDVHLRAPSVDRGVQSFLWALVFFLVLFFGMLAVGVDAATAVILSIVLSLAIFLLVRTRGGGDGSGD
jgi:hypothetical protein